MESIFERKDVCSSLASEEQAFDPWMRIWWIKHLSVLQNLQRLFSTLILI